MNKIKLNYKHYIIFTFLMLFSFVIYSGNNVVQASSEYIYLSDIDYLSGTTEKGSITRDTNTEGGAISLFVDGVERKFSKGIGAHATSTVIYDLKDYSYDKFTAYLGMDASKKNNTATDGGKFTISVSKDNIKWTPVYTSDKAHFAYIDSVYVSLDISGYRYLKLHCNRIGNNYNDHAVYAHAKLSTKDYTGINADFIKTVSEYDSIIKNYPVTTDTSVYELTLLQRNFVNDVGFDILQSLCEDSEEYKTTLKWLMEDKDRLKLYTTGGKPDGPYANSIKALSNLYIKHGKDIDITTIDSVSGVKLGTVYEKMMITLSLTHSKKVHFWNDGSQSSNPVTRYEIYKDLHEKGLLDNNIFDKLNILNMRWVLGNWITDEQIPWLNDYVRKHNNNKNPYNYIKYTGGYNYAKEQYYSPENYAKWDEKYNLSDFKIPYETGHAKLWIVFEEGSVCGGLSKTGSNINASFGIPSLVIGQPAHAAYLIYAPNTEGLGTWSIGNAVYGWQQSNWTDEGRQMPNGWGANSRGFQVSYVLLAQAAINDFKSYEKAEELIYLAKAYRDDTSKQQQIYNLAIEKQEINLDAWEGLIAAYKKDDTKTQADYMELGGRIVKALNYYPLPMLDLLNSLDEKINTNSANMAEFTLMKQNALKKATTATSENTLQPKEAVSVAKYLLGINDYSIANFSFDGENAGKIILSSRFDNSETRLKYSLDGGTTWIDTDDKQVELTNEQIKSITSTIDIMVGLVGLNDTQTIDITEGVKPTNLYNNDLENAVISANNDMEWSFDESTWIPFKTEKPNLLGNVTVNVRVMAKGTARASETVKLSYTQDVINDKEVYIPIEHLSIHDVSSAQPGTDAKNSIDGNINTIWHNAWGGVDKDKYITIKLDTPKYISALQYFPRKDAGNGTLKSGIVSVSMDGKSWTTAANITNWAYDRTLKSITFNTPILANYVKIAATESAGGFFSAAMFNLFEDSTIYTRAEISSTYDKFDLYNKSNNYKELAFNITKNEETIKYVNINDKKYDLSNQEHKEALSNILKIEDTTDIVNIKILVSWLSTLKEGKNKIVFTTNNNNDLIYNFDIVNTIILTERFEADNNLGYIILDEKLDSTYKLKIEKKAIDDNFLSKFESYIKDKELIGNYDISLYDEEVKVPYTKKATVTINIGTSLANKNITILQDVNGNIESHYVIVNTNGEITYTSLVGLTDILIVTDKEIVEEPEEELKLESSLYGIQEDTKKITKIIANTTVQNFKMNLQTNAKVLKVIDKTGKEVTGKIATGMKLDLDSKVQYTLIVTGDLNKDGMVSIIDLSNLIKEIIGTTQLDENQKLAADLSFDGNINLIDLSKMINTIIGIKNK